MAGAKSSNCGTDSTESRREGTDGSFWRMVMGGRGPRVSGHKAGARLSEGAVASGSSVAAVTVTFSHQTVTSLAAVNIRVRTGF